MKADTRYRCPVCRAAFRETAACSRCGADLNILMTLAAQGYALRRQARLALARGDIQTGLEKARKAQSTCATPQGKQLYTLALWWLTAADQEREAPISRPAGSRRE